MRPATTNPRFQDTLAEQRLHRVRIARLLAAFLLIGAAGAGTYGVLWSPAFTINQVRVEGLVRVSEKAVFPLIEEARATKWLKVVPIGNNTLFFDRAGIEARILSLIPEVRSVSSDLDLFHEVTFTVVEREPAGIWCFRNGECRNFDVEGRTWGDVSRSSGQLVRIIEDRTRDPQEWIDAALVGAARGITDGLTRRGIGTQFVVIPDGEISDMWAMTNRGYPIYFNLSESIEEQLSALAIFLDTQPEPATLQYLDLRIRGAVYYK